MVTCESLDMLSLMLVGHFAMIISLEFFLAQFLSIKEVRPFEHFQPVLQPNVIRRVFQPVRSRYDAVIVDLGVQIHFEEFYHFHFDDTFVSRVYPFGAGFLFSRVFPCNMPFLKSLEENQHAVATANA